ncbi:LysR family transcriptional regulator [Paenibacillus protaetiae]|uniref:LysR family transcriptional regulator n=1 Tax=Paenibacillus protaetiae TaxID=2509456 RepID=A0A4P6EUY9_9BACL|nr:LysR family transcriptional regulator [Paenibacillus protaetiae]QAY65963.1 LysR family transcriptional regulator [Paenibacillus protaetiae]
MIHMEWYRAFWYTARFGNLSRAAQELHVTQPSVSYAIKQLEENLGVKLFDRLSKGVQPTAEGLALLDYVEKSFNLLQAGEQHLRTLKELTSGELRIGASGPVIKQLLLPSLDRFHAACPDVRIRLSQGKTSEIRKRLLDHEIDLGLVHLPYSDPELDIEPMAGIQDGFVVGEAYKEWSLGGPLTGERLTQIPLLLLSKESSTRSFVERWLASQGISAEADMELSSMDMLVELAKRGYGAAFVTYAFVQEELQDGQLFKLDTAVPIPPRSVGIAVRRAVSLPVIADSFRRLLTGTSAAAD